MGRRLYKAIQRRAVAKKDAQNEQLKKLLPTMPEKALNELEEHITREYEGVKNLFKEERERRKSGT